jgi:nucleotide-binding universal stress UspA family protein
VAARSARATTVDAGDWVSRHYVGQRNSTGYDLVVLGVSRRPGDLLFFGNTAAAVLEKSPTSNLFVAS